MSHQVIHPVLGAAWREGMNEDGGLLTEKTPRRISRPALSLHGSAIVLVKQEALHREPLRTPGDQVLWASELEVAFPRSFAKL